MFSFPLFERLKAELPEFEEVTAFQAGGARLSVRRQDVDTTARPLRSEYVTGNYFSTLGVGAFGGRVFTAADDTPAAPPVVVLSHHVWQGTYGGDPSIVGATLFVEGHPFTVVGVTPPGFFGETLRGDPPDLWIPLQQEPLINGDTSILRQPVSAWLRVIGRLRPGATTDGMGPRLTGILHQWMQHDSGYPANWMPDIIQASAQAGHHRGAGRRRRRHHEGAVRTQPADSSRRVRAGAAHRLRQRREPAARARRRAARADRRPARDGRVAPADRHAGARREHPARGRRRDRRPRRRDRHGAPAAGARVCRARHSCRSTRVRRRWSWRSRSRLALVTGIVFGAAPAWFATRTDPIDALRGAGRSTGDHSSFARKALLVVQATLSVVLVAGSTMLARSLGNLESQDFGFEIRTARPGGVEPAAGDLHAREARGALSRRSRSGSNRLPGVQGSGLALYNPLTDNWGEGVLVAGHPRPKPGEQAGASWDRVSANYLQNLGVTLVRGRYFTAADNETLGERRGRERSVRPPLLQERRGSDRSALRPRPARERQHLPHRRHRARCEVRRDSRSIGPRGRCSSCRSRRPSTTRTR